MKKLFFAALVAVAAIGGATAQTYYYSSPTQGSGSFQCQGAVADCSIGLPEDAVIRENDPTTGTVIDKEELPSFTRVNL